MQAAQYGNEITTVNFAAGAPEPSQYLTFMLAGEVFAIGILAISRHLFKMMLFVD